MELSSPKLQQNLIFQEGTCKTWKTNISYVSYVSSNLLVFQFYHDLHNSRILALLKTTRILKRLLRSIVDFLSFENFFTTYNDGKSEA